MLFGQKDNNLQKKLKVIHPKGFITIRCGNDLALPKLICFRDFKKNWPYWAEGNMILEKMLYFPVFFFFGWIRNS